MIRRLVQFSLRFRGVVVSLACLLVGYGLYVASRTKLDVLPNFMPPQVTVQAEAPGLTPEEVEALVTRPLENAINGLGQMESLRSESIPGLSIITAVFKERTDVHIARQMLAEKLSETASQLPLGVKAPVMSPLTSATMDLLKVGLVSEKLSPMALRTLADWTLKPRFLAVPGVARCIVFGGEVRQLQIQVQPERLRAFGLAISEVVTAARLATGLRGAGYVENANQRILIETEGQTLTPQMLADTVLRHEQGQTIRLRDVAHVCDGPEPKFGDTLIQGRPGVLLSTASQYGANTLEVTHALEAALEELKPMLDKEGVAVFPNLHRPATFIEASLQNIRRSLFLGGALVSIVLLLFLGHLRTALISLTAIPLSLLTAVIVLDKLGVTLNTITLGGLAIAIGEVVDDAIIDVENIFRRLREVSDVGLGRAAIVLAASLEVRSAVVYATFVVVLVFLPVLAMTGVQGSFFAPLASSYILAILASLLVALTVTPALALLLFGRSGGARGESWLQARLKAAYGRVLRGAARVEWVLLAAVAVIFLVALGQLPQLGGDFLPPFREGHFVLRMQSIPGTSIPETLRMGREVSRQLLANPKIATVEQQVGRAEQGEDPFGPHRCEFHVELKPGVPGHDQEQAMKEIEEVLEAFPGLQAEVVTFLGDRLAETITGESAPVVINIFGPDLDVLDEKARDIAQVLHHVPGAEDVQLKSLPGAPRLAVRLRPERLQQFGFHGVDVLEAIRAAYQGEVVAQVYSANQVMDVAVVLDPDHRRTPESVGTLYLKSSSGLLLPLRELADIQLTTGRFSILHEAASRRQVVTCRPEGRDVTSFVHDAKAAVAAQVRFPSGFYAVFGGAAEATAEARHELLLNSAMAALGVLLLLGIVTRNFWNLGLVLVNVPFALIGGVVAIVVTNRGTGEGAALTLGSLVGFVTLFGITMRNSIMMLSHYQHLVTEEGQPWSFETVVRGASERLVPILMTALVTGLGLFPLAVGSGEAGREIEGPMAVVILGGLISSTILNLLVFPALAWRFGQFQPSPVSNEPRPA